MIWQVAYKQTIHMPYFVHRHKWHDPERYEHIGHMDSPSTGVSAKQLYKKHPVFVFHGDNNMYSRDYAETETQMNPWWAVDLSKPAQLTNLIVHNRKSPCCGKCGLEVRYRIQNAALFSITYVQQLYFQSD